MELSQRERKRDKVYQVQHSENVATSIIGGMVWLFITYLAGWSHIFLLQSAMFRSRIRSRRIHKFGDFLDSDPFVRDSDPDPPIIKQK
jgi:hypothetical protein